MSVVSLTFHINDLDSVLPLYDKIQVWRAATENGTYVEITSDIDRPAKAIGEITGPWALSGKTLSIVLSGADPVDIVFSGVDPLLLVDVLQQINTIFGYGLASEIPTDTNEVRLISPMVGTGSSILLSGAAVTVLGLPTTKVSGKQHRISIVSPTKDYFFKDFDGDSEFWYKIRYFSSTVGSVSSFLPPQQSNPTSVIPPSSLVTASVSLADTTGRPIVGRRVIFVPIMPTQVVGSSYGVLPGFDRITVTTDASGKANIDLLAGMRMKVFFEGSNFNREFTVPSVDFDVLQVAGAEPDPLNIVQAPPMPIRMS